MQNDPKGTCDRAAGPCYPPNAPVTVTTSAAPVAVTFASMFNGMPSSTVDKTKITGVQWQLNVPAAGCTANLTIDDISFAP